MFRAHNKNALTDDEGLEAEFERDLGSRSQSVSVGTKRAVGENAEPNVILVLTLRTQCEEKVRQEG